jgi:Gram-negative porin
MKIAQRTGAHCLTLENFEMKKTLLALAVVAASGAAFAQSATLSGSYVFGFQSAKIGGVKTSGFGTDTAAIQLVATEDLGGGMKATAKLSLAGLMRDGAGTGEDASVSLAGGFGTISMGSVESDDGLSRAYAGAPVIGLDGKVHGANSNIDYFSYTTPQFVPGLTAGLSYVDRGVAPVNTGLQAGTAGPASAQPSLTANVSYGAGPISARFDVTQWTRKDDALVTSNKANNRFRISGNYDLGVVKLGAGYLQVKRINNGDTTKQFEAGISAPIGATTIGAVYENFTQGTVKKNGITVGAQYNLSKRTNVGVGYAQWKTVGSPTDNTFRVLVGHSF